MRIRFNCPVGNNNNQHIWESTECVYCEIDRLREALERIATGDCINPAFVARKAIEQAGGDT